MTNEDSSAGKTLSWVIPFLTCLGLALGLSACSASAMYNTSSGVSLAIQNVQTSASPAVSATADVPPPEAVVAWIADTGLTIVHSANNSNAQIALGDVLQVNTWAPSALNGSAPGAHPVPNGMWVVPVTRDGESSGLLIIKEAGPSGSYIEAPEAAAALRVRPSQSLVVYDQLDNAWYLLFGTSVRGIDAHARDILSGSSELTTWMQLLRERRGLIHVGSSTSLQGRTTDSGLNSAVPLWIPLIAVLVFVVVVVWLTNRHENHVLRGVHRSPTTSVGPPEEGDGDGSDSPGMSSQV